VKISITGRHMHVHDSVKEYALEKAGKLDRYNDQIQHTEIVVANEGDRKLVEMIVTTRKGGKHVGQVEHEDTFAAIDLLMDKMKRQLEREKEKLKNRKHSESARQANAAAAERAPAKEKDPDEDLETYEDVIEEMEIP
jgi:putative sigma-54 modulation protein